MRTTHTPTHARKLSSLFLIVLTLLVIAVLVAPLVQWRTSTEAAAAEAPRLVQPPLKSPWEIGYRNNRDRHKLHVENAQLADQLVAQGARLLADYGSYKLIEADTALAQSLQPGAQAEIRDDNNLILLNAGALDTTLPEIRAKRGVASLRSVARVGVSSKAMRLVQFIGPIQPEWYSALEKTGAKIVTYIPNNAYLVYGEADAIDRLQAWAERTPYVQWDGDYLDEYKYSAATLKAADNSAEKAEKDSANKTSVVRKIGEPQNLANQPNYATVQLFADSTQNALTINSIRTTVGQTNVISEHRIAHYVNVTLKLPDDLSLDTFAKRMASSRDVVAVERYVIPTKQDERQDQIIAGNIAGNIPNTGDYLAFLAANGYTQGQFTSSNFVVDVSDSGIDNGTTNPNHFALHTSGAFGSSRVAYTRLEGTANGGSTLQGCDGHGNIDAHIVAGFVPTGTVGGVNFGIFPHADASSFRYGLGIAPFVKVGSSVIFDPNSFTNPNFANLQARAYADGARISTNSWGNGLNTYTSNAQAYDFLVRDAQLASSVNPTAGNQEMVILFAAGNGGSGANTVGNPGTAKNVITVGASENVHPFGGADGSGVGDTGADSLNDIIPFSSRGPTSDGRIKPDLVAPGTHISGGVAQQSQAAPAGTGTGDDIACFIANGVSGGPGGSDFWPLSQEYYTASSGTSQATPSLAGVAALVRQRFINVGLAPATPAMTKAIMMNSAKYLTGAGAGGNLFSNNQGMGLPQLNTFFDHRIGSLAAGTPTVLRDQIGAETFTATGQTRLFTGTVADNTKPFRVTLAYTDAPGATTGNAFNNNLDLTVTVGGNTYKGNVFTGANSVTGGVADTRNNAEGVYLPAGVSGPYTVTVTATNINSDGVPNSGGALDQDFALVIYNANQALIPVIGAAGSMLTAESCMPANSAVDPGETVTVSLSVVNVGTANTTSLVGTLQAMGGVTAPSAPQNYGVLTAGGAAVSRSFTFTVDPLAACGSTVTATLQLQDGATNLGTVTYTFQVGALGAPVTATYSSGNIAVPIPDVATVEVSINVPDTGVVQDVNVRFRLNHTFDGDLDIFLVAPNGQTVELSSNNGGGGDNYGSGANDCSGTPTVLDDEAGTLISAGTVPFAGSFRPEQALSTMDGLSVNGTWKLRVVDEAAEDVGTIGCVQLEITRASFVCCVSAPPACTIICPMNATVPNATNACSLVVHYPPPTTTGTCGTVTCSPASGSTFNVGTTTVTCSATGVPMPTCSFTVTVQDTQAPTVTCPANITVPNTAGACSATATYATPTATDNCPGATVTCLPASGGTFPVGVTTVTCTASDASPDSPDATCTFTVTVQDTQAPAVTCPANITVPNIAGACNATATYTTPTGTDNCPGAVTVTCLPASGGTFPVGVTTVTCTASDASPNSPDTTCMFTVTVQDTQAPTLTACPANITTDAAAGACNQVVPYTTPTATDNCPGATVTCVPASNSTFPVGVTTVTCTATDASPNSPDTTCTFTITVQDTQAPVVTPPANQTVPNTAGACNAVVTYPNATVTDNCPGATVTCSPASGSTFPVGFTIVTCTGVDASPNSPDGTATFQVTVQDTQAPTITCPANVGASSPGGGPVPVTFPAPTAADNCSGVSVVCVPASGSNFAVGTTTVTCTAADASPFSPDGTCSFTVSVASFTPAPTMSLVDPLNCVGQGDVVNGSVGVANTTAAPQTGTVTVALPAIIVGLPGTCVTNVGTCVVTATTVTWTGTIPASSTLNFSYQAQIANGAAQGQTGCATTTAVFSGQTGTVQACLTINCPAAGPGALAGRFDQTSDQKPGSILFYNFVTSSAASANQQNARISITNTNPARTAYVHLFFVDGSSCSVADSFICLTPNQTATVLHSDIDPGTTGYIVAVATDRTGCPINFNHLIGDEYVKLSSGHAANLAAESISALAGGATACAPTASDAVLRFDDVSYNAVPRVLALDNFASPNDGNQTLLVVNRVGGYLSTGAFTLSTLFGIMYDDAEQALSFSLTGACQLRANINGSTIRTAPRVEQFIPTGRTGWLKLYSQSDWGLFGSSLTFNASATTQSGAFNQGHNLHKLRLTQAAVYTIPVFPPSC